MRAVLVILVVAVTAPARAADVAVHHVLELRLDPAARTVRGVDRVTLAPHAAAAFTLAPGFTVDRIRSGGHEIRSGRTGEQHVLALAGSTEHEVLIAYHGTLGPPPATGELTRSVATPEGSCLLGTGWFPSFDGPFTYEITIDVPDPQRPVTSGRLTAETTADGRSRATFVSDAPLTELTVFAGPYRVAERIHRGWRLRTYFDASVADLADRYLDRVQDYVDLYDGWIGTYPYSGFAVVSSPFPVGLGFPGLTYLGTQVLRLPFIPDTSLGHEVLHSWWGNGVRPGAGGNWAEGLTTFMADYTFVERRGAVAARDERLAWLRESSILPPTDVRPLTAFTARTHAASQATGYHKAAFVFIMLRDRIGPDAFAAGVRRLWQAHRFGSAQWSDLEQAFSSASDVPLGAFFAQWVRRAGAPTLSVSDAIADGTRVSFTLAQAEPAYALAVPVAIESAGESRLRTVRLDRTHQTYALDAAGTPRVLAIDPDLRVFRRLARDEIPPILREVAFDPGAIAVVATRDASARAAARDVAEAFLGRRPTVDSAAAALPSRPLLLVGTTREVTDLLRAAGLDVPPTLAAGTTRAWAARRPHGPPLAVVMADGADGLRAVARPLPHYGSQSFVVFDGARAVSRGLWPPPASPLRVDLPAAAGAQQ
jgi:aminopeptidase N